MMNESSFHDDDEHDDTVGRMMDGGNDDDTSGIMTGTTSTANMMTRTFSFEDTHSHHQHTFAHHDEQPLHHHHHHEVALAPEEEQQHHQQQQDSMDGNHLSQHHHQQQYQLQQHPMDDDAFSSATSNHHQLQHIQHHHHPHDDVYDSSHDILRGDPNDINMSSNHNNHNNDTTAPPSTTITNTTNGAASMMIHNKNEDNDQHHQPIGHDHDNHHNGNHHHHHHHHDDSSTIMIMDPLENDISTGRGASINRRPGNKAFRNLCFANKPAFDAGNLMVKRQVAMQIVKICQEQYKSRFLKKLTADKKNKKSKSHSKATAAKRNGNNKNGSSTGNNDDNNNDTADSGDQQQEQEQQHCLPPPPQPQSTATAWIEMTTEEALKKACQVMRDYQRPDRTERNSSSSLDGGVGNENDVSQMCPHLRKYDKRQQQQGQIYGDTNHHHHHHNGASNSLNDMMTATAATAMTTTQQPPLQLQLQTTALITVDGTPYELHPHDVLSGRGAFINGHIGNQGLRKLAMERKHAFDNGSFTEKQALAAEIVAKIRELEPPGRFLKRTEAARNKTQSNLAGEFYELSDEQAINKACQVMRDINRPDRAERGTKRKRKSKSAAPIKHENYDSSAATVHQPEAFSFPGSSASVGDLSTAAERIAEVAVGGEEEEQQVFHTETNGNVNHGLVSDDSTNMTHDGGHHHHYQHHQPHHAYEEHPFTNSSSNHHLMNASARGGEMIDKPSDATDLDMGDDHVLEESDVAFHL